MKKRIMRLICAAFLICMAVCLLTDAMNFTPIAMRIL